MATFPLTASFPVTLVDQFTLESMLFRLPLGAGIELEPDKQSITYMCKHIPLVQISFLPE